MEFRVDIHTNNVPARLFSFLLLLPSPQLLTSPYSPLSATMMATTGMLLAIASFFLPALAQSSSCSTTLTPANSVQPSVASGYRAQLIATGLSSPRSIEFDKAGNLLVVEQKNGDGSVSVLGLQDNGGTCLSVTSHTTLVTQSVRNANSVRPCPPTDLYHPSRRLVVHFSRYIV